MELTPTEKDFLVKSRICRLATVSRDGVPHNVPIGYAFDGKYFYLSTEPGTKKVKNIKQNSKVCLLVDEPQKPRKAVLVNGQAEIIEKGVGFREAVDILASQRGWKRFDEGEQVVIRVAPAQKISWGLSSE